LTLVTVNPPLKALLKNAVKLAFAHAFWGLLVLAGSLLPLFISLLLPQAFLVTVTFAAMALIIYAGAWRVLRRYLDETEINRFGV
jgi:hypothetical protein